MLILGLETSCDETSAALVEAKNGGFVVHKNLVSSQIKIHRKYGGVVPEVAARRHVEVIIPLIEDVLSTPSGSPFPRGRNYALPSLKRRGRGRLKALPKIDVIAVTAGPGLVTSLLVGVETARTLAYLWKKPLVAVNHLEGHIYANWLSSCHSDRAEGEWKNPLTHVKARDPSTPLRFARDDKDTFPALCLIVSGGHTELILMKDHLKYKLIGQTLDDAAGECFDKVGKMLGLPYPGGPEVARLASHGSPQAIDFPRPMIDSPDFNFSFSGLKTAVLYYLQSHKAIKPYSHKALRLYGFTADICASFQQAAVDVLVTKTLRAAEKFQVKTIMLGGGVAANTALRLQIAEAIKNQSLNTKYFILNTQYCSDNAAMIAAAAYFHAVKKDYTPWSKLKVNPNWELAV